MTDKYVKLEVHDAMVKAGEIKQQFMETQIEVLVKDNTALEARIQELKDRLETTQKNIENWSKGIDSRQWIAIFNEEYMDIKEVLAPSEDKP